MPSIGADLKRIMELAPLSSRLSSPAMRARDEACGSLQRELREALTVGSASHSSRFRTRCFRRRPTGNLWPARLGVGVLICTHILP